MKSSRVILWAVFANAVLSLSNSAFAQTNYLVNSDFSQGLAGWQLWQERFNTRVDVFGVSGADLQLFGGDGGAGMDVGANGGIFQVVDVTPGVEYQVTGYWKSDPYNSGDQWAEVLVMDGAQPVNNVDVGGAANTTLLHKSDSFGNPAWDGTFAATQNVTPLSNDGKFTPTSNTVALVLKVGDLNFNGVAGTKFADLQLLGPDKQVVEPVAIFNSFEGSSLETLNTESTNGTLVGGSRQVGSTSLMFDNTLNTTTNFNWTSEVIDVSGLTDLSVSFAYMAPGEAFETSDLLTLAAKIDGGANFVDLLTLDGDDLDANPTAQISGGSTGGDEYWFTTESLALADASTIQLQIRALTTGNDEDIFIDDVYIVGTAAAVPEANSIAMWGILGAGIALVVWRRRKR